VPLPLNTLLRLATYANTGKETQLKNALPVDQLANSVLVVSAVTTMLTGCVNSDCCSQLPVSNFYPYILAQWVQIRPSGVFTTRTFAGTEGSLDAPKYTKNPTGKGLQ